MRRQPIVIGACLALALTGLAVPASAEPIAVRSGNVVLPMTGLAIELPKDARKRATWMLSGSWSIASERAFDSRDVVDLKVGDRLVAGYWFHVGYFNAGDCAAVVKELVVEDRWAAEAELAGRRFQVVGGTWDFESELGKAPAVALCTAGARGQSLLIYRFFVEPNPPVGKSGLAAIATDTLIDRVVRAWKAGKTGPVQPTRRPEIRRRGDVAAARTVKLAISGLDVALPDDGYVWLARNHGEGNTDYLDRMAPSLPDVSLEVARIPSRTCRAVLAGLADGAPTVAEPPPLGIPDGWTAYGTIALGDDRERVLCRDVAGAALIVGLLATPAAAVAARDFGPFARVLEALVAAAGK